MGEVQLIRAGPVRLAYRESGAASAAPVVLLHALGETAEDWDQVAAALSRSWHVYAVDLRGHGRSDWPGQYTLPLLRDDVTGFLDALGLGEVTLIGLPAGHLVHASQPDAFISAVADFLAEDPDR
ncbi:MAG TPA: alpha/beta fold hydrolase [Streptosporangiaceae bacterium]